MGVGAIFIARTFTSRKLIQWTDPRPVFFSQLSLRQSSRRQTSRLKTESTSSPSRFSPSPTSLSSPPSSVCFSSSNRLLKPYADPVPSPRPHHLLLLPRPPRPLACDVHLAHLHRRQWHERRAFLDVSRQARPEPAGHHRQPRRRRRAARGRRRPRREGRRHGCRRVWGYGHLGHVWCAEDFGRRRIELDAGELVRGDGGGEWEQVGEGVG